MEETRYTLEIEGISALVMNSNSALLGPGEDKGRDPSKYELEHFRDKAYTDQTGQLVIPARQGSSRGHARTGAHGDSVVYDEETISGQRVA